MGMTGGRMERWALRRPPASGEESAQSLVGGLRSLFREHVAALDLLATHVAGPFLPDRGGVIPLRDDTPRAPEHQRGTGDLARATVRLVLLEIDAHRRPIVLAHRVDGLGV